MIVTYKFADGTVSEVEVSDDIWREIAEIEKKERCSAARNSGENRRWRNKKRIGRNILFNEIPFMDGALFSDGSDIAGDYEKKETDDALRAAYITAINELEPQQRELLDKIYTQGIKAKEIAEEEGVSEAAISQRLKKIRKRFEKVKIFMNQ